MGSNAGFGIVVNLSQEVINSTIAAYWSALATPLNYQLPPNVQIAGETIALDATLQFLTPTIALAPNPDNLIATTFGCGGFLSFSIGATAPTTVVLSLSTIISAAVQVADQAGYFVPSLDLSNAVVSAISVNVIQGPPLPDLVNQALNSPTFSAACKPHFAQSPQICSLSDKPLSPTRSRQMASPSNLATSSWSP